MAEYFECDNFITRIEYYMTHTPKSSGEHYAYSIVLNEMLNCPTADVAPVVRCKDCKHLCVWNRKDIYAFCPKTNIVFLPFDKDTRTFFCSYGERKDEANES